MDKTRQLLLWLSKLWPIIVVVLIGLCHYVAIQIVEKNSVDFINKSIASIAQIIGGLTVLVNINQNLGLFNRGNILLSALNFLQSFPFFPKDEPITGRGRIGTSLCQVYGEGHVGKPCTTLEEKINEAQRQIDELRELIYRKESKILSSIKEMDESLKELIYKNQNDINRLKGLVENNVIGGINVQFFGVLLVIYGAAIPFFA